MSRHGQTLAAEFFEYRGRGFKGQSLLLCLLVCLYRPVFLPIVSVLFCTSYWGTGRCQSIDKLNNLQVGRSSTLSSIPDSVQGTPFSKSSVPNMTGTQPSLRWLPRALFWGWIGLDLKLTRYINIFPSHAFSVPYALNVQGLVKCRANSGKLYFLRRILRCLSVE